MKKALLLIMSLCLVFSLCACAGSDTDSGTDEPEPTPQETPDLKIYDKSEGVLEKEVWYNSDGLRFRTVIYKYDGNGNLSIERTLGINDAPEGYIEYVRAENELVSELVSYLAVGPEEYSEEFRTLYEYNDTGLKTKESHTMGGAVVSVTEYVYDGAGRLVGEKLSEGSELISECSYEYNADGLVAKSTRIDHIEDCTVVETFSYDGSGNLTERTQTLDGEAGSTSKYSYDENGNELSREDYSADGELLSRTESAYVYDEPGNIIKCTGTQDSGDQATVIEYTWQYSKG